MSDAASRFIAQLRMRGINLSLDEEKQILFESTEQVSVKDLEKLRLLRDEVVAQLLKEQQRERVALRDNTNYEAVPGTTIRIPRGTWLPPVDHLYDPAKLAQARRERDEHLPRYMKNLRQARQKKASFSWGSLFKARNQLAQVHEELARHESGEQPLDGGRVKLLLARSKYLIHQVSLLESLKPESDSEILSQKGTDDESKDQCQPNCDYEGSNCGQDFSY